MVLFQTYRPYTDIYFLRSLEILQKLNLNPFVRAQVFLRNGPGVIDGIDEAVAFISKNSSLIMNGGTIHSLKDGSNYVSEETILLIEGRAQDVIFLETILLGIISFRTTRKNDRHGIDLSDITKRTKQIVSLVGDRPVYYFGARHWHYEEDEAIAKATFLGGATSASTEKGAHAMGKEPVGSIPHSLENIVAWKYGAEHAVVETIKAFDRIMNPEIPRIALVDYRNREVDDSLSVAKVLGKKLYGIRVDTSGECLMQGAEESGPESGHYWYGNGVTISGVFHLRKTLNSNGYSDVRIMLSSGFGNPDKVKAFVEAETKLGLRLFDGLGVGNLYNSRIATMDIVGVGDSLNALVPIAKTGRAYHKNLKLLPLVKKL